MKALVYFLLGFVISAAFLIPSAHANMSIIATDGKTYCIGETTTVKVAGSCYLPSSIDGLWRYTWQDNSVYRNTPGSNTGNCESPRVDSYNNITAPVLDPSQCICEYHYKWIFDASTNDFSCYENKCSNQFVEDSFCTDPKPSYTCANSVKDDGETGIDCGGVCSDECIKSCPTGEKLFKTSGSSIYYCATVTSPDSNGVCTSGIPNASGTECHKIDFSGLVTSDQDYLDSINNSTDSSDSPVSDGAYNYLDSNPATSGTTTTTKTTTNPDGSTTTTKTVTTIKSNGSTSVTTTKTTTNTDGSTTVSKSTVNYDADGNITGTSSSSGTTDADGNSETESGSDGDEADGDGVVAGDGAVALEVSEDIDLTYGSFGTAWDGFRDELATTTLVASVQAFTNAIPTQSTGPTYTLSFGQYGSHSINTNDYDNQLEIIGYALLIMSSFIGIRIILTGK